MMKDLFVYGPGESLSLAHNIDVPGAPLRKSRRIGAAGRSCLGGFSIESLKRHLVGVEAR